MFSGAQKCFPLGKCPIRLQFPQGGFWKEEWERKMKLWPFNVELQMHPRYLAQSLWTMHKTQPRDFPGSAVVKNTLSVQGAQVLSLVEELRSCMLPGMANHHPQPCHRPTKTKNSKQKQTAKQTDKKPSPNACYGSVVFQRNHSLPATSRNSKASIYWHRLYARHSSS